MNESPLLKRLTHVASGHVGIATCVFVFLDAISHMWMLSHGRAASLFSNSIPIITFILVVVFGVRAMLRLEGLLGFSRTLLVPAGIWTTYVAVSLIVYRGSPSTVVDHLVSWLTLGLFGRPASTTGSMLAMVFQLLLVLAVAYRLIHHIRRRRMLSNSAFEYSERSTFEPKSSAFPRLEIVSTSMLIGLLVHHSAIFDLFARQHVERTVFDGSSGRLIELEGPILPLVIWTVIASMMLGVLLVGPLSAWAVKIHRLGSGVRILTTAAPEPDGLPFVRPVSPMSFMWVVSLGFWVRIASLLTIAPTRTDGGDPLFYHVTANLLARGRGFPEPLNYIAFQKWIPSALHGPAYPVLLSLSSRIGGSTYFDHKFVSVLIGTGVVALSMALAHRVAPEAIRATATVGAGILAAVYPNLWLVDGVLFPEGLMALFTVGLVYAVFRWRQKPKLLTAAIIGSLISLSALTRGEGLLLAVLLVVPFFLLTRSLSFKNRLLHLFAAGIVSLTVLAPWSIRNLKSFEEFVPLSTNGNELFVYANCPETYDGKFLGFWLFQCQEDLRAISGEPAGDEAEKSLYWREAGFDYARENIGDLPKVISARIARQWDFFRPWQNTEFAPIEGRDKDSARLGLFMYFGMIPLAIAGGIRLRRNAVPLLPFVSVIAMVTLTAAYAYGTTRFRVPFEPLLCILASIGCASALSSFRRRFRDEPANVRANLVDPELRQPFFVEGADVRFKSAVSRDSHKTWISLAIVSAAYAVTLPALFRSVGSSMEEGFMLVFPELLSKGWLPNVDFLHLYGPGSLHVLSLWYRMFDTTLIAERSFGLIQHLGFAFGLFVLARPWGRVVATGIASVSALFVLTPVGLQALAWNGALALGIWALIWALRARHRQDRASWVMAGIFGGLSLTFRPDLILAIGLASAYLLWRCQKRAAVSFASGAVAGLLPLLWHLGQAGLVSSFRGMFLDPVFNLRGGRELPRPPSLDRLDGALQVISEKFAPWWGLPHLSAPLQLFTWFFLLPAISILLLVAARSVPSYRRARIILMASALFALGLLPQAMQRPDSAHLLWVSMMTMPMAVVAVIESIKRRRPSSHARLQTIYGFGALAILVTAVLPFYTIRTYADLAVRSLTGDLEVREVDRDGRFFYLGDERPWRATLQVVRDLDSMAVPGERLFVGPVDLRQTAYSDVFFYHLFPELVPATYYIEMDPGLANRDPRLAEDVASADWLVLTRFWSGWIEANTSTDFGSDAPNQIVESDFCLVRSYQNDLVRLFRRCAVGDGIGPYEGPYRPEHDYAVEVLVPVPPRPDGTCTPTCWGRPSKTGIEIGIDTSVTD